jgi:hypothetical protein
MKWCLCGKDITKDERCDFHQKPRDDEKGPVFPVAWFHVDQDDPKSYTRVLLDNVVPLIKHTRARRWYFINHFGIIDVGFPGAPRKVIERIRCQHVTTRPLVEKQYGGARGVKLCYSALQKFSELRVEIARAGFGLHCDHQLMHYFMNQRGFDNVQEGLFHLALAGNWLSKKTQNIGSWAW